MTSQPANDNIRPLYTSIDLAVAGQAVTLTQSHRKFGSCYAEFIQHVGDGKHVVVRKLISSTWKARWTKPMKVERRLIAAVHSQMVA